MISITVIVPTYRRPQDLARCLEALKHQTRTVNQLIVTIRDIDTETWEFLATYNPDSLPLQTTTVTVTGVVAAMNKGLSLATGDIITFTDDDAAPHPDWLERMEANFQTDEKIGAVGGRDWQYIGNRIKEEGDREDVGRLQWFGRVIGNHHFGVGKAREVDVLKGVNMGFRRNAIQGMGFDERMLGTGAQVHFELAFNLALRRRGWKIIFDPLVAVDHYPAVRFDEDKRDQFNNIAWLNAVHNETLVLLEHFSLLQRTIFIIWAFLIGTREALGLLQLFRLLPSESTLAVQKWVASVDGRIKGLQSWLTYRNVTTTKVAITK
ncbi:glycosyltransferase family 2 protein [Brunnivagina elsteri]|uniref:Glycosyl transferase family A n=1 Tax=Brunnivagina elsteri CCALA 953 TaxID=987040 RepID=A0A2A2TEV4_9CYAN|nr:glycosyltransferase family 2 protein [Calothrix elsteri]PAX52284.1 glycosyl transferase family A [Calothrix elsteri CCALA 953]